MNHDELTPAERNGLKKLLGRCEVCGPVKDPAKDLDCHRINRKYRGGKYVLRNIALLCNKRVNGHHQERHEKEEMGWKG